jgi:hypothetical protein
LGVVRRDARFRLQVPHDGDQVPFDRPPTPSRQTILATSPEDVAKAIAEARARSNAAS